MMRDLFGRAITIEEYLARPHKQLGPYQKWKRDHHYRRAESRECCKTCQFLYRREKSRMYYKCVNLSLSFSSASDVRLRDVCDLFMEEVT